jgi:proteic killer suppression protein
MLSTFKCRDTEALLNGRYVPRLANIATAALRIMAMLSRAERLEDLRVPPGNSLEALSGDRAGQWSIRVNVQWRLCFRFQGGHAHDAEMADYH